MSRRFALRELILWSCWCLPVAALGGVSVSPSQVGVGTFYRDVPIRITGEAQQGSTVVIVVRGADIAESFNKKGRVGPIWLNVGKVRISGVPSLLMVFWPAPPEKVLHREQIDRYQLDQAAVLKQIHVEPAALDEPEIRQHYWALKSEQGAYRIQVGAIRLEEAPAGAKRYSVEFPWPRKAPPGRYIVAAYECHQGQVVAQSTATLVVSREGLPALVAKLATSKPALYGVMAVMTAMLAGFGIDFLVSRSTRRSRKRRAARLIGEEEAQPEGASELRPGGH